MRCKNCSEDITPCTKNGCDEGEYVHVITRSHPCEPKSKGTKAEPR